MDPELDGKAMDDGEGPNENRGAEDMDMSEEEAEVAAAEGRFQQRRRELLLLSHKRCPVGIQSIKMCFFLL